MSPQTSPTLSPTFLLLPFPQRALSRWVTLIPSWRGKGKVLEDFPSCLPYSYKPNLTANGFLFSFLLPDSDLDSQDPVVSVTQFPPPSLSSQLPTAFLSSMVNIVKPFPSQRKNNIQLPFLHTHLHLSPLVSLSNDWVPTFDSTITMPGIHSSAHVTFCLLNICKPKHSVKHLVNYSILILRAILR